MYTLYVLKFSLAALEDDNLLCQKHALL